jgi:hypothetical protein
MDCIPSCTIRLSAQPRFSCPSLPFLPSLVPCNSCVSGRLECGHFAYPFSVHTGCKEKQTRTADARARKMRVVARADAVHTRPFIRNILLLCRKHMVPKKTGTFCTVFVDFVLEGCWVQLSFTSYCCRNVHGAHRGALDLSPNTICPAHHGVHSFRGMFAELFPLVCDFNFVSFQKGFERGLSQQ